MMVKLILFSVVLSLTYRYCSTTRVQKCSSPGVLLTEENSTIDNQVFISGCDEQPCKFSKNSTVNVEIHFQSEYDVNRLTNSVYAWVLSIPFPYYGVDGTTACNNLLTPARAKASCPIRKGQKYIYKNSAEIKASYPKIKITLHWALLDGKNNAPVFCFEVPVKIVT